VDAGSAVISGGCMCGGVRYELSEPFVSAGYCHCTRCQRRTGSAASASARTAPGSLRIVAGADLVREWRPENGWVKASCSVCGSQLWSRDPDVAETVSVRLGTVDGDPGIRPQYRQYVAYAAPWEPIPDDGLPRFDERRV
jgi:hypothetical protein